MVILIALLHGVVVIASALFWRSRKAALIAAIVAGALGLFTGNPAYIAADLAAVGVSLWISLALIPGKSPQPAAPIEGPHLLLSAAEAGRPKRWAVALTKVAVICSGIAGYFMNNHLPGDETLVRVGIIMVAWAVGAALVGCISGVLANAATWVGRKFERL